MPKITSKKTLAYTLIELLITLSVIVILFGIGFLNYRDFSRRQTLISFGRKIKGDLYLAREKAISGEKPEGIDCSDTTTLSVYNFRVTSETQYVIEAVCSGGSSLIKTVDLPEDLEIAVPSTNPISFKVLSKGTNLPDDIEFVVRQNSSSKETSIYITKGGEIR